MIAKCPCQHCGVNIEFDTGEFLSGSSVTCPKCGLETPIFVTPEAKGVPTPNPTLVKTAKIVFQEKKMSHGGMESTLDELGGIFFGLGLLAGGIAIIAAIVEFKDQEAAEGIALLCVGVALIFASFVNQTLFKAAGEALRLLKKLNGLKFSGTITQPDGVKDWKAIGWAICSACNNAVGNASETCPFCGAKFEK